MKNQVILDTGPLVAFLNHRDKYHNWIIQEISNVKPPFLTCETVISEACYLLRHHSEGAKSVLELIYRGFMRVAFDLNDEIIPVKNLIVKYADVPISLADACLVRMSEIYTNSFLITLDSDFQIYRKYGNQIIQCIMPNFEPRFS